MSDKDNNKLTDEELEQVDGGMINDASFNKNPLQTNKPLNDDKGDGCNSLYLYNG